MSFNYDLEIYEMSRHGRPRYRLRGWSSSTPMTKGEQVYIDDGGELLCLGEVESISHVKKSEDKVARTKVRLNMLDPNSPMVSVLEERLKDNYGKNFEVLGQK